MENFNYKKPQKEIRLYNLKNIKSVRNVLSEFNQNQKSENVKIVKQEIPQ